MIKLTNILKKFIKEESTDLQMLIIIPQSVHDATLVDYWLGDSEYSADFDYNRQLFYFKDTLENCKKIMVDLKKEFAKEGIKAKFKLEK